MHERRTESAREAGKKGPGMDGADRRAVGIVGTRVRTRQHRLPGSWLRCKLLVAALGVELTNAWSSPNDESGLSSPSLRVSALNGVVAMISGMTGGGGGETP